MSSASSFSFGMGRRRGILASWARTFSCSSAEDPGAGGELASCSKPRQASAVRSSFSFFLLFLITEASLLSGYFLGLPLVLCLGLEEEICSSSKKELAGLLFLPVEDEEGCRSAKAGAEAPWPDLGVDTIKRLERLKYIMVSVH